MSVLNIIWKKYEICVKEKILQSISNQREVMQDLEAVWFIKYYTFSSTNIYIQFIAPSPITIAPISFPRLDLSI